MSNIALLERIIRHPSLPSPSPLALRVLEKASRPDCSIASLGALISGDPALCAQMLLLVNSALFSLPRAVTSIERALSLLGLKRVRSVVLALSLPALRQKEPDPRLEPYWKAWVAASTVARELGARLGRPDPESDLVAALLCDLGMLALREACPEEYNRILEHPTPILIHSQCALEAELLGLTHAEVSAAVLKSWHLPPEITEAVRYHHDPEGAASLGPVIRQGARLLCFAGRVGQLEVAAGDTVLKQDVVDQAQTHFGLGENELGAFLESLAAKTSDLAAVLRIEMGQRPDYNLLTTQVTEELTRLAVQTSLEHYQAHEQRNRAQEALLKSEERLRQAQKMEAIGRLAGGIAHDFNNLLTVINGYSELLLQRLAPKDPTRDLIEHIHAAGDRAASLTAQLLGFSRKQIVNPGVLDLNRVVANMEKMLRRVIGEDIELAHVLRPDVRPVKADAGQVEQVLLNLILNARDAMPRGGKIQIETTGLHLDREPAGPYAGLAPGDYAVLSIADTGCGMDEATRARIFEPFFTTKDLGKGTGLGLATVYSIIQQSGGHIEVESALGRGTTFRIYLPATAPSHDALPARATTAALAQGTETILVAEDEPMIRSVVRTILERAGYTVLDADDGEKALAVGREHAGPIHLLLADTIMPRMGGPELAERLGAVRPGLKVLYMSGYPDEKITHHGVLGPGTSFLQKPIAAPTLAAKIRELLGASAAKA
jgi:signal transduction histidine kinase/ActR/RegA family two-component response regulator